MPPPMRRYTITDEEKRGTLLVAGWREIEGRWFQKFEGPEMYEGRTLDSAFRTWMDRVR